MTFSTPDLCDAFGEQPSGEQSGNAGLQVAEPVFQSYGGKSRFAGHIATLKCFEDNSLVREAVSEPGKGRVLVVDGGGSLRRALLGDQLAAKAVANGWQGIIINGCLRDVDEINTMNLGVRALASHPLKTYKRGEGQRDLSLHFAAVHWHNDAYVYADNNGIIVAPRALT